MRFLTLIVTLGFLFGCDPYRLAWTTTAGVREAAFQAEASIAKKLRETVKTCSATHAVAIKSHNDCIRACDTAAKAGTKEHDTCKEACRKTPGLAEYQQCIARPYAANAAWIERGRPAINSALVMTVTTIQLLEAQKQKPSMSWMEYLKPAVCALAQILAEWKDVIPDNVQNYIGQATKFMSAATCEKK
jgi:hypothetical protein